MVMPTTSASAGTETRPDRRVPGEPAPPRRPSGARPAASSRPGARRSGGSHTVAVPEVWRPTRSWARRWISATAHAARAARASARGRRRAAVDRAVEQQDDGARPLGVAHDHPRGAGAGRRRPREVAEPVARGVRAQLGDVGARAAHAGEVRARHGPRLGRPHERIEAQRPGQHTQRRSARHHLLPHHQPARPPGAHVHASELVAAPRVRPQPEPQRDRPRERRERPPESRGRGRSGSPRAGRRPGRRSPPCRSSRPSPCRAPRRLRAPAWRGAGRRRGRPAETCRRDPTARGPGTARRSPRARAAPRPRPRPARCSRRRGRRRGGGRPARAPPRRRPRAGRDRSRSRRQVGCGHTVEHAPQQIGRRRAPGPRLVRDEDAVGQRRNDDRPHVVGTDVVAPGQQRPRTRQLHAARASRGGWHRPPGCRRPAWRRPAPRRSRRAGGRRTPARRPAARRGTGRRRTRPTARPRRSRVRPGRGAERSRRAQPGTPSTSAA